MSHAPKAQFALMEGFILSSSTWVSIFQGLLTTGGSAQNHPIIQPHKNAFTFCELILLPLLFALKCSASWKISQASLEQVNHVQDFNFLTLNKWPSDE